MKTYLQRSSGIKYSDHWKTPKEIYDHFIKQDYFDPCPIHSEINGLKINWGKKAFVNPPYSDIKLWIDKAIQQSIIGCHVVLLIPSRTDTVYFHKLLNKGIDIEFIKGRLKFGDSKTGAPFPSVLVYLR